MKLFKKKPVPEPDPWVPVTADEVTTAALRFLEDTADEYFALQADLRGEPDMNPPQIAEASDPHKAVQTMRQQNRLARLKFQRELRARWLHTPSWYAKYEFNATKKRP